MPLLSTNDKSGSVRVLDSFSYADFPLKTSIGGVGVSLSAFAEMSKTMQGRRVNLRVLETMIESRYIPTGDGRLHRPFRLDKDGREIEEGSLDLQIQNTASTQMQLMEEIRQRVHLQHRSNPAPKYRPTGSPVPARIPLKAASLQSSIDMNALVFEVQQASRNMFTTAQTISLSKMIAEWLTLVEVLIKCAVDAETELTTMVAEINAERQAMWKLAADIICTVLTFAAPPPFGAMIGGIVKAVMSSDSWTSCISSSSAAAMSATYSKKEEVWEKNSDTNVWGPSEKTVFKALETRKAAGGQESLADYKDIPAMIGGVSSCLGKSARERFEEVNKKTLMHVTDMPDPPKGQANNVAQIIRDQSKEKIKAILTSVHEMTGEFMSTESGPASLVHASYVYQEKAIASRLVLMKDQSQHAQFLRDRVKEGALLYLNTVSHEMMVALAASAKPKFNTTDIPKDQIQKEFEILFWAGYLGKAALNEPKAKTTFGKGAPKVGAEDYYAHNYGVIKKLVWMSRVAEKLNSLGITQQFQAVKAGRFSLAKRSVGYEQAIRSWRPPIAGTPWTPVPYQDGGSANSKGRLAAWAVEFNRRPPVEIFDAIMGVKR